MLISPAKRAVISNRPTTWNPSDTNAGITLLPGNLSLTATNVSGYSGIRAKASAYSGKKYWEVLISTVVGFTGPGFGNATASLSNYTGQSINGVSWFLNGTVYQNAGGIGAVQTFTVGDTCCVALDLDTNKVWFRTNGGNWNNDVIANQNPATNTGGITFTNVGKTFPMLTVQSNTDASTANFGRSAYAQSVPAGFVRW